MKRILLISFVMSCFLGLLFSNSHEMALKQDTYSNVRYISGRDITTFPWREGFDNPGNNPQGHPDGWIQREIAPDNDKELWTLFKKGGNLSDNCMGSISTKDSEPLNPDNWLITPMIKMPATGVSDFVLRFYVRNQAGGALADSLIVYLSADGNQVYDFETTIYRGRPSELWSLVEVSLSRYARAELYFAFRHRGSRGRRAVYIDDIFVGRSSDAPEVPADFNAPYAQNFENVSDIEDIKWSFQDELGAWIDWDGGVNESGNVYLRFEEDLDVTPGFLQTPSIDSITDNMTLMFAYRAMDHYGYPTVATPGDEISIRLTYSADGGLFENTLLVIDDHETSLDYKYITIPLAGKGFDPKKVYVFRFEVEIVDGYPRFDLDEFMIADPTTLSSISGIVTANSVPIPKVKLVLSDFGKITYTDDTGAYKLDKLLASTNNITATKHGYFYKVQEGIILNVGENKTVNIELTGLPRVTISGKILSEEGPMEWAYVKLYDVFEYEDFMTVTDSKGEFNISVFADTGYELQAFKPGFNVYTHSSEIDVDDQDVSIQEITLDVKEGYLWEEDFESKYFPPIGWTMVDQDGDGVSWIKVLESDYDPPYNFEGNFIASQSYWEYEYFYKVYFPDNYLISPRLTLPTEIPEDHSIVLTYYVFTMLESAPIETYSVLVSETGTDIADFKAIYTKTLTEEDYNWQINNIDLTDYLGKNIFIAFRHHDSTNQFLVGIDKVRLQVSNTTETEDIIIPSKTTTLHANYPNPFNPTTTIKFRIENSSKLKIENSEFRINSSLSFGESRGEGSKHVSIDIFNIKGQKVRTLVDGFYAPGEHSVVWNGTDNNNRSVSSGIYFYKMETEGFTATRKMVLIK